MGIEQMFALKCDVPTHAFKKTAQHIAGGFIVDRFVAGTEA